MPRVGGMHTPQQCAAHTLTTKARATTTHTCTRAHLLCLQAVGSLCLGPQVCSQQQQGQEAVKVQRRPVRRHARNNVCQQAHDGRHQAGMTLSLSTRQRGKKQAHQRHSKTHTHGITPHHTIPYHTTPHHTTPQQKLTHHLGESDIDDRVQAPTWSSGRMRACIRSRFARRS